MKHSGLITEVSHRAMATEFVVMLAQPQPREVELAVTALEELDRFEAAWSVYQSGSEISRLNRAAGQAAIKLGPQTFALLEESVRLGALTNGAFDITAGPLVEAWGFTRRSGGKPTDDVIKQALELVGRDKLQLDPAEQTAALAVAGMLVNLGAIGKGFAIDQLASRLRRGGMSNFLIHGGYSSVLAVGDDHPATGGGWKVAIAHPLQTGVRLGGVRLRNQALGTSGSGKQFFHHQGKRLGHVIDPRTGWPAGDILSLTVVTQVPQIGPILAATQADALATGLFVAGWQAAQEFQSHSRRDSQYPGISLVAALPTDRQADVTTARIGVADVDWIDEPAA